jgi:hypothetical protein
VAEALALETIDLTDNTSYNRTISITKHSTIMN